MPSATASLPSLEDLRPRSTTDHVFEALYDRVVNLTLPPGSRLSEAEVASQMGVSRQPVRDAFYRLSQLGFVQIRPQRATTVTPISEEAVMQAHFIRTSLEEACMRVAATRLTKDQLATLDQLIARQEAAASAGLRDEFHALDDEFHRQICEFSGLGFVWTLVKDNKGHMDRARYLSLSYNAGHAIAEHRQIIAALHQHDPEAAAAAIRQHLIRIQDILARIRTEQPEVFAP